MANDLNTSYTIKRLEVRVTLRAGQFNGGGNTKIITDVPIKCRIEKTGMPCMPKASVECRGLKLEDMELMSTQAMKPLFTAKNTLQIFAGDEKDGLKLAFSGQIVSAFADFNKAPDVAFKFDCKTGYFGALTPQGPSAIGGSMPVGDFIGRQAKAMGLQFQNDGVQTQLKNAVFNGSPLEQAHAAARQVGAEMCIDDDTIFISPKGGAKMSGDSAPEAQGGRGNAVLLNKNSGLLGYPTLSNEGVAVKCLYNPAFRMGGLVKLESVVPKASGTWRITKVTHDLTAFDPSGGTWESQLQLYYPNRTTGTGYKIG